MISECLFDIEVITPHFSFFNGYNASYSLNMGNEKKVNPPERSTPVDDVEKKEKQEKEMAGGRNGIDNIGNTCYMNTGLQVIQFVLFLYV